MGMPKKSNKKKADNNMINNEKHDTKNQNNHILTNNEKDIAQTSHQKISTTKSKKIKESPQMKSNKKDTQQKKKHETKQKEEQIDMNIIEQYEENTLYWAIYDDYPPWPCRIAPHEVSRNLQQHYKKKGIGVLFLEENSSYALVDVKNLFDFNVYYDNFKSNEVKGALKMINKKVVFPPLELSDEDDESSEEQKPKQKISKADKKGKKQETKLNTESKIEKNTIKKSALKDENTINCSDKLEEVPQKIKADEQSNHNKQEDNQNKKRKKLIKAQEETQKNEHKDEIKKENQDTTTPQIKSNDKTPTQTVTDTKNTKSGHVNDIKPGSEQNKFSSEKNIEAKNVFSFGQEPDSENQQMKSNKNIVTDNNSSEKQNESRKNARPAVNDSKTAQNTNSQEIEKNLKAQENIQRSDMKENETNQKIDKNESLNQPSNNISADKLPDPNIDQQKIQASINELETLVNKYPEFTDKIEESIQFFSTKKSIPQQQKASLLKSLYLLTFKVDSNDPLNLKDRVQKLLFGLLHEDK